MASLLPIPAIDLMDGQVVRLARGEAHAKTVYSNDPAAVAASFEAEGAQRLHIVDLDGAFKGAPMNFKAICSIRNTVKMTLELGGGLRTRQDIDRAFELGIDHAILGTAAVRNRELLKSLASELGERLIVGIDARDGAVAIEGWVETSTMNAFDFAKELELMGIGTIIYTDIATDGMMTGPNLPSLSLMADTVSVDIIASGGIRNLEDLLAIQRLGKANLIGAITGRAIYEKTLDLGQSIRQLKSCETL